MDDTLELDIEGFDELDQALHDAPDIALPFAETAVNISLQAIYANSEPYPDETIANSPQNPSGRWYERNYGPRWIRKSGVIGGSPTSQQLQLRWKLTEAQPSTDGVEGTLEDTATYSAFVKGTRGVQSRVMAKIGWTSIEDDIAASQDVIDQAFSQAQAQTIAAMVK